ncbi:thioredoxin-like domain-containing protein [Bacteroides sp.]|uniref:TlpA family protein disulfide reductase n=1 Tax=Bacteroides sp. TaxID=29523 RepID=UPI002637D0E8|nr:thioredoxin-like domain-containing protein [Bacteroides sp.]MDD3036300.1 thioredoxin-like domain-containing protein [Bacteroides sp.]
MKTALLFFVLLFSGVLSAQTIDNPSFKARSGSISNITRIERTSENTRLYIHAIFRPHWWISMDGDEYLEDADTGKKYMLKSAEGIEIKKEVYMPASGTMDYVLVFEPLPKETKTIHYISPSGDDWNTFDISLTPQKGKKISPLQEIKGNWYRADISNRWEYGVYDSVSIMENQIFTNESIRKKGKRIELTAKDKKTGETASVVFTKQKNGNYKIQINGVNEYEYTQQSIPAKAAASKKDFQQFFHSDTTYIQGYIDGYDPRLKFETGLIYLENVVTGESYPTVVPIAPDGSFTCKFLISHPIESAITLGHSWISFFIEPGQTLTMYIDWESVLARSRARSYNEPSFKTDYMGPSADLSYLLRDYDELYSFDYGDLAKQQKTLSPSQYQEHMKPTFAQWESIADSVIRANETSSKAVHLIKNKLAVQMAVPCFEFLMGRDYYAREDTTNQVLKIKEDASYYDFLKKMPLDDEVLLADNQTGVFINRFEYMDPFDQRSASGTGESMTIILTYPKKPLLTFLKEKGVKLNAEQEAIRLKHEKLAGKSVSMSFDEHKKENDKLAELYKKEEKLVQEYGNLYKEIISDEERSRDELSREYAEDARKDSIITALCGRKNPVMWQIAKARALNYRLKNIKTREIASEYIDHMKQSFTIPYLSQEADRMLNLTHPENKETSYQLPKGKAADIFRNIIKNHPGKILFVDFWATSCGPCRHGIETTADLRKKYKDHPEFQFIYITGEKESPKGAYNEYVEKHLKGEASYYVTETEFNYLRELFHFNGIPHYELVEKDGSISRENVDAYNLSNYLEHRFNSPQSETKEP